MKAISFNLLFFLISLYFSSCQIETVKTVPRFDNVLIEGKTKTENLMINLNTQNFLTFDFEIFDDFGLDRFWICLYFVSYAKDHGNEDQRFCQLGLVEEIADQKYVHVENFVIVLPNISILHTGNYHIVISALNVKDLSSEYHFPLRLLNDF